MGLHDVTEEQLEQACEVAQILSFIKGLEKGLTQSLEREFPYQEDKDSV